MRGAVAYVDVNKMYLAVEAIERPELDLSGDPRVIVVGGDPRTSPRSIVTTANQVARNLGITSGLSTAIAARLAREHGRETLFLPPRHELYAAYSRRLMALLRSETPLLQQNSIDEAALAWGQHGFDPLPARRLRVRVQRELGLLVSVGVAANVLVAKMASEAAKREPEGVRVVGPGEEPAFLGPLPVRALVGVGPKAEVRLRALGAETIADLAALPLPELVAQLGSAYGRYLARASRGEDDTPLDAAHEARSLSAEHTFARDTTDRQTVWRTLRAQAHEVAERLQQERVVASEVAIKLRYSTWETITRQQRLGAPTDRADVLAAAAAALVRRHWDRRPIRLIGLRAARLGPPGAAVQLPLPTP